MKILFILNGEFVDELSDEFLRRYDKIVCVDGGLNNFEKIKTNIIPDYIIGDFDSVDVNVFKKYKNKSKIIKKDNQDESDLVFALKNIVSDIKNINNIDICCATGGRIDHTLCSILTLKQIDTKIKSCIVGNDCIVYLFKNNKIEINVKVGQTISLIPLTNIVNINTQGFKWELNGIDLQFGFVNGISNIALNKNISVSIEKGECLIIINK
jgi:thiamine pyrophosphokinase